MNKFGDFRIPSVENVDNIIRVYPKSGKYKDYFGNSVFSLISFDEFNKYISNSYNFTSCNFLYSDDSIIGFKTKEDIDRYREWLDDTREDRINNIELIEGKSYIRTANRYLYTMSKDEAKYYDNCRMYHKFMKNKAREIINKLECVN